MVIESRLSDFKRDLVGVRDSSAAAVVKWVEVRGRIQIEGQQKAIRASTASSWLPDWGSAFPGQL